MSDTSTTEAPQTGPKTATKLLPGMRCQESSRYSTGQLFVACGREARFLVDWPDRMEGPYPMCLECAWHSVKNRRARAVPDIDASDDTIYMPSDTEPSKEIALLPRSEVSTIIGLPGAQSILDKLLEELSGYTPDGSSEPGRKEAGAKARRVGEAKMSLIRLANKEMEDAQTKVKAVRSQIKIVETRMDTERDRILKVIEDYKAIDATRVAAHRAALSEVESWGTVPMEWPSARIVERIEELKAHPHLSREWQEFSAPAQTAARNAYNAMVAARVAATERETEAARLAEEERLLAEAETLRLAQEEAARIERARAEAAAEATRVAEARATELARHAEEAAQREREAAEIERQRLQSEMAEAARLAAEAEARRVARHKAALSALVESADYSATETSAQLAARLDWMLRQNSDTFEEFADEAATVLQTETERIRSLYVARLEMERKAAERREAQITEAAAEQHASHMAELARQSESAAAADRTAERDRAAAETKRLADEAAARAADKAHRAKINREALHAIMEAIGRALPTTESGEAYAIGREIIAAIARGSVPHITIGY